MRWLYGIGIRLYGLGIAIAALWNPKAKMWVQGRKNWRTHLQEAIDPSKEWYWFHCASLGEFEQGRPLIEIMRKEKPNAGILLTFFSPSGYEIRKDYDVADHVCYLPLDTPKNAQDFVRILAPKAAVFMKYEFWGNLLVSLDDVLAPRFLVSAIFRKEQHFFSWYGGWFRKVLKGFKTIFVQDQASHDLLQTIQIKSKVAGDTRFDRVLEVVQKSADIPILEEFADKPVLVLGSSWPKDEEIVSRAFKSSSLDIKLIIVPHEVDSAHIQKIQSLFPTAYLFSKSTFGQMQEAQILIIDQIGMLSRIYRYADVSLIGGGFGKGIHNTLEAAAWEVPVCFGPNYKKFKEAAELIKFSAAKVVHNEKDLENVLKEWFSNEANRKSAADQAGHFVRQNAGATGIIMEQLLS